MFKYNAIDYITVELGKTAEPQLDILRISGSSLALPAGVQEVLRFPGWNA